MTPDEARALLESVGAVLEGHFLLTSGRHSDVYVQKARILEQPEATMALGREIASWYPDGIDVTVSPAVGAVTLGFAVGLAAGARAVFAEREEGAMRLRRGFALASGERALVVEDVVTTGGSAGEVFELVRASAATELGVAAIVDRSAARFPFPFRSVLEVEATSWPPEECRLCREGRPFTAPGSRNL